MLVRNWPIQSACLLHDPCKGLAIVAQRGFTRLHCSLLRIRPELIGGKRSKVIEQSAHANNASGATGDQTDPASHRSTRSTDLPRLLAVEDLVDPGAADQERTHHVIPNAFIAAVIGSEKNTGSTRSTMSPETSRKFRLFSRGISALRAPLSIATCNGSASDRIGLMLPWMLRSPRITRPACNCRVERSASEAYISSNRSWALMNWQR